MFSRLFTGGKAHLQALNVLMNGGRTEDRRRRWRSISIMSSTMNKQHVTQCKYQITKRREKLMKSSKTRDFNKSVKQGLLLSGVKSKMTSNISSSEAYWEEIGWLLKSSYPNYIYVCNYFSLSSVQHKKIIDMIKLPHDPNVFQHPTRCWLKSTSKATIYV